MHLRNNSNDRGGRGRKTRLDTVVPSRCRQTRLFRAAASADDAGSMSVDEGSGHGSDEPGPTDPPSDGEAETTSQAPFALDDLVKLGGIFGFKHLETATDQGSPAWFVGCFKSFTCMLTKQTGKQATWADLSLHDLNRLTKATSMLDNPGPGLHIEWLPMFGCALLPLMPSASAPAVQPNHVVLYVVAPDSWSFDMHSCPAALDHTSRPSSTTAICSGTVPAEHYHSLVAAMHSIIQQQQAEKQKEKQHPGGSRKSHFQRTPAFIHSAVQAGLKVVSGPQLSTSISFPPPRGGFTDVGQHTGGKARATSWPLVLAMTKVVLQLQDHNDNSPAEASSTPLAAQELLDQAMLHFELWIMSQLVQQVTPATAVPAVIDAIMVMLQSVTGRAADLAVAGLEVAAVEAACATARQQLQTAMSQRQLQAAQGFHLPADATAAAGSWRLPQGVLPPQLAATAQQQGLGAAYARAVENLGSLRFVPLGESLSVLLPKLLQLLQSGNSASAAAAAADVSMQHSLRTTEMALFRRAAAGFVAPALAASDVGMLAKVVDSYRVLSHALRSRLQPTTLNLAMLLAELRSREVLVGRVAYCLMHQAAAAVYPLVLRYGVALDWQDLRHLTLTDRAATEAALGVSIYLLKHSKPSSPLFHLSSHWQQPTLRFAEEFAAADTNMCSMLEAHNAAAAARMDEHWRVVQQQQKEAARLRGVIADLHSQRSRLQTRRSSYSYDDWTYSYDDWTYKSLTSQISSLDTSISTAQSQLRSAETPPPPVIQPLPRQTGLARQWLFLLHMPDGLRLLARASCLAQQLLLPQPLPISAKQQLAASGLATSLPAHYNARQADTKYHTPPRKYQGSDGPGPGFVLNMSDKQPPNKVGPNHIDSFYSREDDVWFPDSLAAILGWQGSSCSADVMSGSFFDPFRPVDNKLIVESFTAKLPDSYSSLQWAMYQYGSIAATARDRGNLGLATQGDKPDDLSKPAYLALTALRSFPHRQLHRLCEVLRDKELPLEHPAVQLMIQQTVYHLGELADNKKATSSSKHSVSLLWRTGWSAPGGVLDTLCFELQQLADELDNKPRGQGSMLLLGPLAAYLSDWHAACTPVARQFAVMTSRYADHQLQLQIDVLVKSGPDEKELAELKAKQTRWRAMALLCFAAGPLDGAEVGCMLRLMLLIKHGDVYQPDQQTAAELSALRICCHDVMARRLPEIIKHLDAQPELLTAAAASILERLQQQTGALSPPVLPWERLADSSSGNPVASYQAVGSDGHLYSINVLDGTLLFDGNPPGRLPNSILQHRLYRRTFAGTNHEIKTNADGQLETIRSIAGRFCRFNLVGAGSTSTQQLVITELDPTQAPAGLGVLELQLLDPGEDHACASWGQELPVRLRELHSHWYDRQHGIIVVRPEAFNQHAPHFIISCSSTASAAVRGSPGATAVAPAVQSCWRVPHYLQDKHWSAVLMNHADQLSEHQLVLPDMRSSQLLAVLGKFERAAFVHVYMKGHCPGLVSKCAPGKGSRKRRMASGDSSSGAQALSAQGSATAGMRWHLPRCGLEFELMADGSIASLEHRGYKLCSQQLLVDGAAGGMRYTLPEFHQYLVLQAQQGDAADAARVDRSEQLVLVPSGQVAVQRAAPGSSQQSAGICLQLGAACSDSVKVFMYQVHGRFGYLQAHCNTARLQLAALYAASGTLLPEPASQLTGAATAMMLVRHSWTNEPLSTEQQQHLQDASSLGGFLAPALRLLAHDLAASAAQLQHLHVPETGAGAAARHSGQTVPDVVSSTANQIPSPVLCPDAVSEYLLQARKPVPAGFPASPRLQLTADEEAWLMHTGPAALSTAANSTPDWKRWGQYQPISRLPDFPVASDYVQKAEAALKALVQQPKRPKQSPKLPLPELSSSVPVARDMLSELQHSWDCYHQHPEPVAVKSLQVLFDGPYSLTEVTLKRSAAEAYLLQHLGAVPDSVGPPGMAFRLLVLSASQPAVAPTDLLGLAWGHLDKLLAFNPFLSKEVAAALREGVLLWLQLCVLEDRLTRLQQLAKAGEEYTPLLIRELLTHRTWDVSSHPQWCVFEVEGRLQIRPSQVVLANRLLSSAGADGPGPIAQLNMGEGKTRVILPMMILELANKQHLVRVNFLSPLLHEGKQHLQQHLTASVLRRQVFYMPFHRGIQVSQHSLGVMEATLSYCQHVGGVMVMAPEHRNSLHLKYLELALAGKAAEDKTSLLALKVFRLLHDFSYQDILDESDEVLHHHRRQLVYAWGDSIPLPALEQRMQVVQSLLLLLSKLTDEGVAELSAEGLTTRTGATADRQPGSFCGLQLLSGHQLDRSVAAIQLLLAQELVSNAPLQDELGWMKKFPAKNVLIDLMTNCSTIAVAKLSHHRALAALSDDKRDQVLAARGLLACGLLVHCLQSRHRVNYGVNRSPSAKKRLAVPYHAADLPSERSEFSQPDVALLYTHLAYYGDGLSRQEFKAAVQVLLTRGPSEQAYHYNRWLAQGQAGAAAGSSTCVSSFDAVDKVDPHNNQLMEAMWGYFSHNMEVVNYWLSMCVLPLETKQYPSRLTATAWHLAQNPTGNMVGFSGTNDNHRLLPSQVQQVVLDDAPELEGTNGKMLDMLLQHASYGTLQPSTACATQQQVTSPVWQLLVQTALQRGVDAIIDCGALLAGVQLRSAAQFILDRMPAGRYRGVTFFCSTTNAWVILDTYGRLTIKASSHLHERETLVLFDDARCRGADLKLRQTAVGLLTLAAGMPKDKLMQAAGRLRQLGRGQTLVVTGLPDVSSKVQAAVATAAEPDMSAVLTWVMHNTVSATLSGITEAASQGMQFAATYGSSPELCVWPEKLSVEDLYGSSKGMQPLPRLLSSVADQYKARQGPHDQVTASKITLSPKCVLEVQAVQQRFCALGTGHSVLAGQGADEECERELEQEEEEEEEQEVQVAAAQANSEQDWDWARAFTASSPTQLQGCQAIPLSQVLQLVPSAAGVGGIKWCDKVWASHNFVHSITQSDASPGLSDYLRPVGALLVFNGSKELLLLSEREADAVQRVVWTARASSSWFEAFIGTNQLLSLSYLRAGLACQTDSVGSRSAGKITTQQPPQQLLLASVLPAARASSSHPANDAVQLAAQLQKLLPVQSLVSVQLFAGCVMYGSDAQRALLHKLMCGKKEAAQELMGWRGKLHMLPRSDLDRACADD